MRLVIIVAACVMLLCRAEPSDAQEVPDPQTRIAHEIDGYVLGPRSAATYRALSYLGDPGFLAPDPPFEGAWNSPLLKALNLQWSDCRWAYADKIYQARRERFGETHPYVRQWLAVQRAVFSRCNSEGEGKWLPIPKPMRTSDDRVSKLQSQDRAYQVAASLFYQRSPSARAAFAAIAASPGEHQAAAKLTLASIDAGSDGSGFAQAKASPAAIAGAEKLLADPKAKSMQANAHDLIGWIGATADTREGRRAQVKVTLEALGLPLSTIRNDAQARARYYRSLEDLPQLFTDFENDSWWITGAIPKGYYGSLAMAEAARTNPLAAFALTKRTGFDEPPVSAEVQDVARKHFEARTGDHDAWRVVLLQTGGDYSSQPATSWAEIDALLARIGATPTDHDVALLGFLFDYRIHYAFGGALTTDENAVRAERAEGVAKLAAYPYKNSEHFNRLYSHALNVLIGASDIEGARRLRDLVEPQRGNDFSWSVDSDMLLLLAEDEDAMVRVITSRNAGASTLLNRLSARQLARLAADERIDPVVRKRFARVAWTRNFVLGRKPSRQFDGLMRSLNGELASQWVSRAGAKAGDHSLLLDVLNTPGMNLRIESRSEEDSDPQSMDYYEHSRNNWWCIPDAVEQSEREEAELAGSVDKVSRPALEHLLAKSYVWQSLDPAERRALAQVSTGPEFLSNAAIRWAKKASARKPKGADEALALAVRSTRYGCQMNGGHGAYSKAAWDLLHLKFPGSNAALHTPWWFDCKHFTYGCTDSEKDDQSYVDWQEMEAEMKKEEEERRAAEAADPQK